jgi:EAL domain-containing protein (putative c-di-GMP-specific phosphodiesterase class I)
VSLKDIRTLPVNDLKTDKSLTLRILTSKGVEIARSEIRTLQPFYISPGAMIELKNQKFDITQGPASSSQPLDETKKGLLNMKIRFQPAVAAESGMPVSMEESKGT